MDFEVFSFIFWNLLFRTLFQSLRSRWQMWVCLWDSWHSRSSERESYESSSTFWKSHSFGNYKTNLFVNGIFLNFIFFSFRLTQSLKWHTYLAFEMQLSLKQPFQIDLASQCQEWCHKFSFTNHWTLCHFKCFIIS